MTQAAAEIPTEEILSDIAITESEINDFSIENTLLGRDPVRNKVKIYMNQGHISQRESLIATMRSILTARGVSHE